MKLVVAGATGLVGQEILKVLQEHQIKIDELIPVASENSIGRIIKFDDREFKICSFEEALTKNPDAAIFSAGKDVSLKWAPEFAKRKITVIDNSSAWRMNKEIKLVVPEVNAEQLNKSDYIIANPNCSTIQLVVVLWPLHKFYGLKRIIVSTYQSVSGSGYKGINQLFLERNSKIVENPAYPHQIDLNCIPHGGAFLENEYTEEEIKLVNESSKIMSIPDLKITGTVVRVPVIGGHSESVNIEFQKTPDIQELKSILKSSPGIILEDNPGENKYPMPLNVRGKDAVFVGRIRKDLSNENAVNLWIVADNLRKGAATNAVQILEYLLKNNLL
jgi:aspartate-semialdehyde dehydrogenase